MCGASTAAGRSLGGISGSKPPQELRAAADKQVENHPEISTLVVTVVIVWLTAGALFWVALTGLQLRFELASRKNALVPVN